MNDSIKKKKLSFQNSSTQWHYFVTFLGGLSDPFKWLSDLQRSGIKFGHELNHLGYGISFSSTSIQRTRLLERARNPMPGAPPHSPRGHGKEDAFSWALGLG